MPEWIAENPNFQLLTAVTGGVNRKCFAVGGLSPMPTTATNCITELCGKKNPACIIREYDFSERSLCYIGSERSWFLLLCVLSKGGCILAAEVLP